MTYLQVGSSRCKHWPCANKSRSARPHVLALAAIVLLLSVPCSTRAAGPEGQLTWAVHVTLAPTWFDPAETSGIITPYMMLYAVHDAMVKPMPGNSLAPSLAESVAVRDDKHTNDMTIRKGAKFHDGTPVTAEDVKFSFERYRGAQTAQIKGRVASIEMPDSGHVRFKLKTAWPDFLTFYASATGAGDLGIDVDHALRAHRAGNHWERQVVTHELSAQVDRLRAHPLQPARHDREVIEGAPVLAVGPAVAGRAHEGKAPGWKNLLRLRFE